MDQFVMVLAQETAIRCEQLTGKEAVNLAWAFSKMEAGFLPCRHNTSSPL